jgi:transposase
MQQYSNDLRRKLIQAWQNWDESEQELADGWGVSRSWLQKVIRRWRRTGEAEAASYRHGPVSRVNAQRLAALIQAHPDATLAELGRRLRVSIPTVCRALQQLGLPRQKSHCTPVSATRRASRNYGRLGGKRVVIWTRKSSSLSMKVVSISR